MACWSDTGASSHAKGKRGAGLASLFKRDWRGCSDKTNASSISTASIDSSEVSGPCLYQKHLRSEYPYSGPSFHGNQPFSTTYSSGQQTLNTTSSVHSSRASNLYVIEPDDISYYSDHRLSSNLTTNSHQTSLNPKGHLIYEENYEMPSKKETYLCPSSGFVKQKMAAKGKLQDLVHIKCLFLEFRCHVRKIEPVHKIRSMDDVRLLFLHAFRDCLSAELFARPGIQISVLNTANPAHTTPLTHPSQLRNGSLLKIVESTPNTPSSAMPAVNASSTHRHAGSNYHVSLGLEDVYCDRFARLEAQMSSLSTLVRSSYRMHDLQRRPCLVHSTLPNLMKRNGRDVALHNSSCSEESGIKADSSTSSNHSSSAYAENNADYSPSVSDTCNRHPAFSDRLKQLHKQCKTLRQSHNELFLLQRRNWIAAKDMINEFASSLQKLLIPKPLFPITNSVVSNEKAEMQAKLQDYRCQKQEVEQFLEDLSMTVEELRLDVLRRRCRLTTDEVELLALHLSHASQGLAQMKNQFPELAERNKMVIKKELNSLAQEEKFLASEEETIESSLRRVKKLTMMLYTFKQLAEVQASESGKPVPVSIPCCEVTTKHRLDLLESIRNVQPDSVSRVSEIERTELAADRRRRLVRASSSLRAEKCLVTAARRLRSVDYEENQFQTNLTSSMYSGRPLSMNSCSSGFFPPHLASELGEAFDI